MLISFSSYAQLHNAHPSHRPDKWQKQIRGVQIQIDSPKRSPPYTTRYRKASY